MNTSRKATIFASAAAMAIVAALLFSYPAVAAGPAQSSTRAASSIPALTVGQTVTLTSSQGACRELGVQSSSCTASGTLVLTVTGVFKAGYTLSLTSGTLTVNGTTYTVNGGSAMEGRHLGNVIGQGTTSNGASFLFHAKSHGSLGAGDQAILTLDFKTASAAEYGVRMLVAVS